jgi:hypothetical protein
MRRAKIVWSPVEIEYLKKHKSDPQDQLCIALSKSRSALDKKMVELGLKGSKKKVNSIPKGKQSRAGKRPDLGIFLRSSWEANMMRLFQSGQIDYKFKEYEPETFSFTAHVPPRGLALSYTPDFQVVDQSKKEWWVEVKGNWLRSQDKTKLRRFKKFYPKEFKKLIAVVSSKKTKTAEFFSVIGIPDDQIIEYNELKKKFKSMIPHWED